MFKCWAVRSVAAISVSAAILTPVSAQTPGDHPTRPRGTISTEESWIVAEIVSDITEMSAYATKPSAKPFVADVDRIRPGLFRLSARGEAHRDLDLRADLWDTVRFAGVARNVLGAELEAEPGVFHTPVHLALLDLTPLTLTRLAAELSSELSVHMRNAALHEAAALTIGAFAMRESSGRFNDVRWALNRMTAHLAVAHVLSTGRPGIDGRLAEAVRLTLSGQQALALDLLNRLDGSADAQPARAWTSALRLRITQDWRQLGDPTAASRLQRLEYFRARRASVAETSPLFELERLHIDAKDGADWLRILQTASPQLGVEDGRMVAEGFGLAVESREFMELFGRHHGGAEMTSFDALNARATRAVSDGQVSVLPWGAWAEFAQRHLAMLMVNTDRVKRSMLAEHDEADAAKQAFDRGFDALSLQPLASIFRGKGKGSEYDLARINGAVAFAAASPDRVSPFVWQWLERAAAGEAVVQRMIPKAEWFHGPSVRMPLEAGSRWASLGLIENLTTVWRAAPHDYALSIGTIRREFGDAPTQADIRQFLGARLEYDTRAIDFALEHTPDDRAAVPLLEQACDISAPKCITLGETLAALDRTDAAVQAYERAFASPEVGEVTVANNSRWLVMRYEEAGQRTRAVSLAERGARAYSRRGLTTAGLLYERLNRLDDAEEMLKAVGERYGVVGPLLGFYFRMVNQRGEIRYEPAWRSTLRTVFPGGLQPAPSPSTATPPRGVVIYADNADMVMAGLQAGDIIIALEGYRVENLAQYDAINECFRENPEMTFTMWRGENFERKLLVPGRAIELELRSHPIATHSY